MSVNANHTGMGLLVEKACFGEAGEERKAKARGRRTIRSVVVLTRYLTVRYSAGIVIRRLSNRSAHATSMLERLIDWNEMMAPRAL